MFHRYLAFLKIATDEFSDVITNAELHADRVRLFLIDDSWIEVRYPVADKFFSLADTFFLQKEPVLRKSPFPEVKRKRAKKGAGRIGAPC
jgi:hypothetical protein